MLSQVEREINDSWFPALGHHVDRWTTSAKDKAASARIERKKGDGRGGVIGVQLGRQIAVLDDRTTVDRDVRSRQGTPEIKVGLVLAARALVVRPHRDVAVPGHDRALDAPGPSVRMQSDTQVPDESLEP